VENEFGEVNIDSKLIKGVEASRMFELKNGCICCTISNEYELALAELAEKFPDVDHLLIETTGIANPAPVIRPFFADEKLNELFHFNGTVCLVDALNYHQYPAKAVADKQIAIADYLFITKSERLKEEQKMALSDEVKRINRYAKTAFTAFGFVADFHLSQVGYQFKIFPEFATNEQTHGTIQTKTFRFNHPLELKVFNNWLSYHLDIYKEQIYRVKGILCFENEPYYYILQGVGGGFELTESDNLVLEKKCELVIIGNLEDVNLDYFP
jgi:G3E family GTPase